MPPNQIQHVPLRSTLKKKWRVRVGSVRWYAHCRQDYATLLHAGVNARKNAAAQVSPDCLVWKTGRLCDLCRPLSYMGG